MNVLRIAALVLLPTVAWAQYYAGLTPTYTKTQKIFKYSSSTTYFADGWSDTYHVPVWSAFTITRTGSPTTSCTRPSTFASESGESPVITHSDYTNSGYDRGHMTPNSVMAYWRGCTASTATFITSNICPQVPAFNQGIWEKLEARIGGINGSSSFTNGLIKTGTTVWVYCGPVFASGDAKISSKSIDVPAKFWKTVIWKTSSGTIKTCSWIFNNASGYTSTAFMSYTTTIRAIQAATGVTYVAAGSALLDQKDSTAFTTDSAP